MCGMLSSFLVAVSILALAAGDSNGRCLITNNWSADVLVPGEGNVLIWEIDDSNRDVLLSTMNGTEAQYTGAIARNVSQGAVLWVVPLDITKGDSNVTFSIQLWDLKNGGGCSSPSFRFAAVNDTNETTTAQFFGPFITTAVSIINTGNVTVTATLATYSSDQPQFLDVMGGSITATDRATIDTMIIASATSSGIATSADSDSDNDDHGSGPNVLAIVIGTVGGVVLVAVIFLSVLFWRIKQKRANEKAVVASLANPKDVPTASTLESHASRMNARQNVPVEVLGETSRHEMMGDSRAPQELPSQNMEPMELSADEIPPPSYTHGEMLVSSTSGASRRSSLSFDKGTFTVSPLSDRIRKE